MARLPRFILPGHPQHVIVRGNNREIIFVEKEDYSFYLEVLEKACKKHNCEVHAYVLMTNHVHLLISPHEEEGLSKVMQMIGRYYVQYFNVKYQRTGTLWEGRYKAPLIESETYGLVCYRYIELNPVRARMVEKPEDYEWSSYRKNALGEENKLITPHDSYQRLSETDEKREGTYRNLFFEEIDEVTLNKLRDCTNKSWVLGNEKFKLEIEKMINRRVSPLSKGGDRKSIRIRK